MTDYCTAYHCAGDCDLPHNQRERAEHLAAKPETVTVPLEPLVELLTELHESEYLSEQQCARLLGWDLLTWRMASQPMPHPFAQEP
jgi:hypothetical protein